MKVYAELLMTLIHLSVDLAYIQQLWNNLPWPLQEHMHIHRFKSNVKRFGALLRLMTMMMPLTLSLSRRHLGRPLSRSKRQMSTCRGRGHIVAASRTAYF